MKKSKEVLTIKKTTFFPLLSRCVACMVLLDVTSRRPEPQNGFLSTLRLLSIAVL
ncbi:hypothetical protein DPMN_008046 [Dreissena polymorpha]|uniref:Uncharacterized protein n=1 Tax=Dreissena polymorpha TaxID=45954 RepID=A0A9D4MYG0_DREPO|nr:hypothetical protein DPMN_008046 [Dreissena polymorpha]